jgi:hypothetical protein
MPDLSGSKEARDAEMSKKNTTDVQDAGVAKVWQNDADVYQISFISIL